MGSGNAAEGLGDDGIALFVNLDVISISATSPANRSHYCFLTVSLVCQGGQLPKPVRHNPTTLVKLNGGHDWD